MTLDDDLSEKMDEEEENMSADDEDMTEDDEACNRWYDRKSELMASMLGAEHDMVMHSMIPFAVGGSLDLYYYPNGIPGTGIGTKELSDSPTEGSCNDVFDLYELVMFTRHPLNLDLVEDESTPFGAAHRVIGSILNCMAPYSAEATLNPCETCEFPEDMETVGGRCMIFDDYGNRSDNTVGTFGLLVLIEIFREEMDFARKMGGQVLLDLLKKNGHYPYSDLDRESVV